MFSIRSLKIFGFCFLCVSLFSVPAASSELGSEALAPASKSNLAVCKFAQYSEAYAEIARQRQIDCALTLGKVSVAFRNSFDNSLQSDWPLARGQDISGFFGGQHFIPGASLIKLNDGPFNLQATAQIHGYSKSEELAAYILSVANPAFLQRQFVTETDLQIVLSQKPDQKRLQMLLRNIENEIISTGR